MDTIYTKKDFQKFILENITNGVSINGRPAKSIGDIFLVLFLFIGLGIIIMVGGCIALSRELSWSALFAIVLPTIHISTGIWKYLQLRVYRNLEKYFQVKEILLEKQGLLEKIKKDDEEKKGIDPLLVEEFGLTLRALGEAYGHLEKPVRVISKGGGYFSKDAREKLEDFASTEQLWMIEYMKSCQAILSNWMSHHASELRELIEQNKGIQKSISGGENAMDLANTRLGTQIETLERVRIRL